MLHKVITAFDDSPPADPELTELLNYWERGIVPATYDKDQITDVQAILMTVYRTLERREHDPLETISSALKHYIKTGALPPLPE